MSETLRVQVLMKPLEAERFTRYCEDVGHKKSTLIAWLIRHYLDREGYSAEAPLVVAGRDG